MIACSVSLMRWHALSVTRMPMTVLRTPAPWVCSWVPCTGLWYPGRADLQSDLFSRKRPWPVRHGRPREAAAPRKAGGLRAGVQAQLAHDVEPVLLDGLRRQLQLVRDLGVGEGLSNEAE